MNRHYWFAHAPRVPRRSRRGRGRTLHTHSPRPTARRARDALVRRAKRHVARAYTTRTRALSVHTASRGLCRGGRRARRPRRSRRGALSLCIHARAVAAAATAAVARAPRQTSYLTFSRYTHARARCPRRIAGSVPRRRRRGDRGGRATDMLAPRHLLVHAWRRRRRPPTRSRNGGGDARFNHVQSAHCSTAAITFSRSTASRRRTQARWGNIASGCSRG